MNILRLTPHFYYTPDVASKWEIRMNQIGGMQIQIYRLAKALSKMNIKQTILPIGMKDTPKIWDFDVNTQVIRANLPMLPIKSRRWGSTGLYAFWALGAARWITRYKIKKIFSAQNEYDKIHVHCSGVASPLLLGIFAKYLLGKPLIYTVHCCRASTYTPIDKLDLITNNLITWIERKCLSKAESVIVLTHRTKSLMLERYKEVSEDRVKVIPDMIAAESFSQNVNESAIESFKTMYAIPDGKTVVTYVGRVDPDKGWKYFIKAIPFVKTENVHYLVCGDGNERKDLEKMVLDSGVGNRVTITGFLANDVVPVGMYVSDIIVVPSEYEEFGSILLEAASMKKPVIASNVGGIPEIIADGVRGILVPARSPEHIAGKIDYLIEKKEIGIRLRENAFVYVKENFSEEKVTEKLVYSVY